MPGRSRREWRFKGAERRTKNEDVTYIRCIDEYDMLQRFLAYWQQNTPEIITGWNCTLYDIPYLAKRITRILGEKASKQLSPWGLVTHEEIFIQGRGHIQYDIAGITVLDYLDLYKKFTYKAQESYRLDYICLLYTSPSPRDS